MDFLDRFAQGLAPDVAHVTRDVAQYVEWQVGRSTITFDPATTDDVDLRTYLLHLKLEGAGRGELRRQTESLKRFYRWAAAEGLILENPFESFDFDRPLLGPEDIRRRQEHLPVDPHEREITRLRAFNQLAQQLNRSIDIQTALDATLATLVEVMDLQAAWIFLTPELFSHMPAFRTAPPHDFALGAARGLPPGLVERDHYFLCQPPDCSCQLKLREGHLTRAINIVECTRLLDAAAANGDTRGLLFHASTPLIVSGQTYGLINIAAEEWEFFTSEDLSFLSIVGSQVAVALERALLYETTQAQRQRLEREMKLAREVQAGLMPHHLPTIDGFDLAAHWQAAREVSGDFYDLFPVPGGRWGVVIGDVSDKGAPAALYMAMTRSLVQVHAGTEFGPAETLRAVNRHLMVHSETAMFVTLFYGLLEPLAGEFCYASAGHDPPFVRRRSGRIESLAPTGPLLGIVDDPKLEEKALALEPGDALLLYTDGVTDAIDGRFREFGPGRLTGAMAEAPDTAAGLLDHILAGLDAYCGEVPQPDDVTMFALVRTGGGSQKLLHDG